MKKFLFFIIAIVFSTLSWGQSTANYTFTTGTTGSFVDMSTGTTTLVPTSDDDTPYGGANIGFNFIYMGVTYTQFSASPDGFIKFGSAVAANEYTNSLIATTNVPKLAVYWDDLATGLDGYVKYKTIGTAPNRQLVVEWFVTIPRNTSGSATSKFQLILNETSGVINYVYGTLPVNSGLYSIGMTSSATQFASVTVSTNTVSYATANDAMTDAMTAGKTYTFTPLYTTTPADPITMTFTAITLSTITVNWVDNSTNESFFNLTRATDAGFTTGVVTSVISSTNTATIGSAINSGAITGLLPGTTYYFKVTAGNEANPPSTGLTGSQATTPAATYYWVGATGGTWTTAANWNTAADGSGTTRTTVATTDILIVDGDGTTPGAATIINVDLASFSIGQFKVTSNTACTLQSSATTTRTITLTGSPGDDFVIENGSTLNLNHAANAIGFAFSGTGNTGDISGTYNTSGSTSNIITTTGGTNTLVTVSGTGAVNNSILGSSGCFAGSTTTLTFAAGSSYTHSAFTTTSGLFPSATWNASSNITITGGTTSTGMTNAAQTFGNITYNSTTSTGTMSVFTSGTTTIQGNLNIVATGTGKFRALTSGTLTVNGNLNVSGGTFELASTTGTMNVIGNINVTGGSLDLGTTTATGTINLKGSLTQSAPGLFVSSVATTGNPTLNFNGPANQAITFATQPTGAITYRISNFFGVTLSAPFANFVIGNGTLGGLRISTTSAAPVTLAGSLTALAYNTANSTLAFDTITNITASALLFPATSGPSGLTVNIGAANTLTLPFSRTLPGILTMTSGYINIGANNLTLGTSAAAPGTLTYTAGSIIPSTGTFTRWFPVTGLPTSVGTSIGYFPLSVNINGLVINRQVQLAFSTATALTTGGSISCGVATAPGLTTGLSVADTVPNYTINSRTNSSWTLTPDGTLAASGTIIMRVQGSGALYSSAFANFRLMKAASIVGRNAAGTGSVTDPQANRTALSVADITGTFYIGAADSNISNVIYSAQTGNWNTPSSWVGGIVPTSASTAVILNTHAISVTDAESAIVVAINSGGTLNVNAGANLTVIGGSAIGIVNNAGGNINITNGTLTLGPVGGGNRTFTNNGSLTVASGTLNINGNINTISTTGNVFTQSGGNINVDGNAAGNALNSVASGTNLVIFSGGTPTTLFLTGGVFTIVDPHASSTGSYALSGGVNTATNCGLGHTFVFGDGVSVDKAANGFYVYLFPGSSYLQLGNVIVNGSTGMDRFVTLLSNYGILGNLTINTGGDWRTNSSSNYFAGNITVNSGGIFSNPNTLTLASYANATYGPSTTAQTISGSGTYRNLIPAASVAAGGTGYVVGDILTVTGGTYTAQAKFMVTSVTTGAVTGVLSIGNAGYSVVPVTPTATTGGTGTGCTLTSFTNMISTANTTSLTINNSNISGVTMGIPQSISGTLTLTAGIVNTTSSNLITIGTATSAGFVSSGSATAYVNGPLARTFGASRSAIVTQSTTTLFPVGKSGTYLPVWIDPVTTASGPAVVRSEAFLSNAGSSAGNVTNLSQKRWEALVTSGNANFTSAYVQLNDAGIVLSQQILQSNSAAGIYSAIPVPTAFTTATLTTTSALPAASYYGYFSYGNLSACAVPGNQANNLIAAFTTTTSFNGSFTPATSSPSNYLVVRYSGTPTITTPVDYTTYAVGASALGGTIISNSNAIVFTQSGLTAATAYTYYVYSYNNSLCYGPIYNINVPLVQIITTCSTPAIVVPGTPTSSLITTGSFTATWAASTTVGVSYVIDVANDAAFTSFVAGYNGTDVGVGTLSIPVNGLSPSSLYYARVRANSAGCYSAVSGTLLIYTLCNPETAPTLVQNFSTYTGAAPTPFCWTEATGTLAASSALTYVNSKWTSETGFANAGSNPAVRTYLNGTSTDWIISQPIDLGATVGAFNVKYNMAVTSNFGTTVQSTLGTHIVNIVVSNDGGTTWSNANIIKTYTGAGTYSNTGQIEKINIPYSGVVKIAFVATTSSTTPSVDFHIDDFVVEPITAPTVVTTVATLVTGGTAQSGGNVTDAGGLTVSARGVCWSTSASPLATGLHTTDGSGAGSFISNITGLTAVTQYYYRAYATNSFGTAYGTEYNFTTTLTYAPSVTMGTVTSIGAFSATAGGTVTSDGGQPPVTENGFVYATTTTPLVGGIGVTKASASTPGLGVYSVNLTGLNQLTLYYINAFATNAVGTAYGTQTTFTTLGQPTITTTVASNIEANTANSGGNITSENGSPVTDRGVCWATTTAPISTGLHTTNGSGIGIFTSSITGLTASTKYYYRAFATNIFGTSYGAELNFTTNCVNSPTATPASRCGTGTVNLSATAAVGTINWYTASSGGSAIGTGSPFTTPIINATTDFYVAAGSSIPGTDVAIGAGATTSSSVAASFFPGSWGGTKTQYIIKASELSSYGLSAGSINSIGFVPTTSGQTYQGFFVNIGHTTETVAPAVTFISTGLTQVYAGTLTDNGFLPVANAVNTLTFGTGTGSASSFIWDGVSNIIVSISWSRVPSATTATGSTMLVDNLSFVCSAYRQRDSYTPQAMLDETSVTSTSSTRPKFIFNGVGACSSARTLVTATVNAPPALTITAGSSICNNSIYTLSVTSTLSDFDSYVWTPATGLYTDNIATIPYVAGSSATTVYVKNATAGTTSYVCTALNTISVCANTATSVITVLPVPVITGTPANICVTGSTVLNANPATGYGTASFQWKNSSDSIIFADIAAATSLSYTTPTLTSTEYYSMVVSLGATVCSASNIAVVVNNPLILTSTPATRCGTGTVNLAATASPGATLNWYAAATGGSSIGNGSPFTTPIITSTTTFYVGSQAGNVTEIGGRSAVNTYGYLYTNYGIAFNVIEALKLNSVTVYPVGTGTLTLLLVNSAGVAIDSTSAISVTGTGLTTPNIINLGFNIPVGNNYKLVVKAYTGLSSGLIYDYTNTFPYVSPSGAISVTSGWSGSSTTTNYYFYDLNVSVGCKSARTPVVATVTPSPVLTLTPSQSICNNVPHLMSVTSTIADYDTYVWTPATNLFTDAIGSVPYVAGASATTVYVKTATPGQLIYTCTANNIVSGCSNITKDTITVREATVINLNASQNPICANSPTVLTGVFGTAGSSQNYVTPPAVTYPTSDEDLGNITFGSLNNTTTINSLVGTIGTATGTAGSYSNFTAFGPYEFTAGSTYSLSLTSITSASNYSNAFGVYIDYNRNGVFTDPGEQIYVSSATVSGPHSETTNITIPANASGGITRMRVISNEGLVSSSTQAVYYGEYEEYTLNLLNYGPGNTFAWDNGNIIVGTTNPVTVSPATTTGYTLTATDANLCSATASITVTISSGITNVIQPVATTKCAGQTATFTTSASGAGLTYQWRKNGVEISALDYPSAITATLTLTNVSSADAANYDANISSSCGGLPTTTNAVALTVNPLPTAVASSNSPACSGTTLSLTGVSDIGTSFHWTGPNSFVSNSKDTSISTVTIAGAGTYSFSTLSANGCASTIGTTSVTVNLSPTSVSITPSAPSILVGDIQQLVSSGGNVPFSGVNILTEDFNGAATGWTTINNSTLGVDPLLAAWTLHEDGYVYDNGSLYTYHSNDNSQFYLTNGDAQGTDGINATILESPVFSTVGFTSVSVNFYHYYLHYASTGKVEASVDGTTWTTLKTYNATNGSISPFTLQTVALTAPFLNQSTVYLRFKYDGVYGYFWAIDNVSITGAGLSSAPLTWSPTTDLYTNALATIPYTGAAATTVYAKPALTATYTATATSSAGCPSSSNVFITVTCPVPTALNTISLGTDNAKVGWTSSSPDFDIEYGVAPYTYTGIPTRTGISSNSLTITSLQSATTYVYKVRANCSIGSGSLWSAEGTFTTNSNAVPGLWTGAVSTDWSVAGNWSDLTVPTAIVDVVIPSAPVNQPHVTLSFATPAVCNNLTINTGASLTIEAGKALTISGITTNNAGNTGLLLKSDASGTGSLLHGTSLVNATVERFIPHTNTDEFHMLASPVASQAIAPNFNELDGFYVWNEPTGNWIEYADAINFAAANGGTNFVPGKGYAVSYPLETTKTFTGALNQGAVNIPLTFTSGTYEGWNYVANPYPSSISWDAASGWTRTELEDVGGGENAMWVWNAGIGNYGTYISNGGTGTGTNDVTSDIPLSQGFWVKAISAGTLSMTNDIRLHSSQAFLKTTASISDMMRLEVSGTSNSYRDEMIIKFGNMNDLNGAEKMFSMDPVAPSLYSSKLNKNWSINNLTSVANNPVVPVGFKAGVNGNYTIKATELNSFSTTTYVYLKDLTTNTITDLNQNANYSFTATTIDNANRFQLLFALSPLGISDNVIQNTSIYSYNNSIYVNSNETVKLISIYNALGQLIKTVENMNGKAVINMKSNASGYYLVRVVTNNSVYSEKVLVK